MLAQSTETEVHGTFSGVFFLPYARAVPSLTYYDQNNNINTAVGDSGERSAQPALGGGISVSFKRHFGVYFDYSYIFGDTRSAVASDPSGDGVRQVNSRNFYMYGGGLQYKVATSYRWVPFLHAGLGALHENSSTTNNCFGNIICNNSGTVASSNNDLLVQFGGGVLWTMRSSAKHSKLGLRIGGDGYWLPTDSIRRIAPGITLANGNPFVVTTSSHGFVTVGVGVFYQFH
jgi:hypothetical protein